MYVSSELLRPSKFTVYFEDGPYNFALPILPIFRHIWTRPLLVRGRSRSTARLTRDQSEVLIGDLFSRNFFRFFNEWSSCLRREKKCKINKWLWFELITWSDWLEDKKFILKWNTKLLKGPDHPGGTLETNELFWEIIHAKLDCKTMSASEWDRFRKWI